MRFLVFFSSILGAFWGTLTLKLGTQKTMSFWELVLDPKMSQNGAPNGPQNGAKMEPKWHQNLVEIDLRNCSKIWLNLSENGAQMGLKMVPKWSHIASKSGGSSPWKLVPKPRWIEASLAGFGWVRLCLCCCI